VLSNTDGWLVSRSAEARSGGMRMGAPLHEWHDFCRAHGVIVRSSNYALYGDMSRRMVEVLGEFSPEIERYSIDESFLALPGDVPTRTGVAMRAALLRRTRLACGVGMGPTKTLAKFANHVAKQQSCWGGVFNTLDHDPALIDQLLAACPAGAVWGVGYRLAGRLAALGIDSALALKQADPAELRRRFSVVQERVVRELNGESCLSLEILHEPRRQLMSTRSFGQLAWTPEVLHAAVAHHAGRVAERLRAQRGRAQYVQVMIRTNPNRGQDRQHRDSEQVALPGPSADTGVLVAAAVEGLRRLYRPGHGYQKVGVMLGGLCAEQDSQPDLFRLPADPRRQRLMAVMDRINGEQGRDTLHTASVGLSQRWHMRSEMRSPRYTTCLAELPVVRAD
ncbi:MAG: Y-family DNA polymerase, partial [Perlucidibaca sp.]